MFKKLKGLFLVIFTILLIISIFVIVGINYFGGLTGKIRNGENFCINNEYSIGKMLGGDNKTFFCNNKISNKCIGGIRNYSLSNNKDLYLLIDLSQFTGKDKNEINNMLNVDNKKGWAYSIFQNDYNNRYYAKKYDEIIRFLKVNYNDCNIKFYSNIDLEKISSGEQNIFKSLEK